MAMTDDAATSTLRRYRKTALVWAEQAKEPGTISTPEGVVSYSAGDYIVSDDPPTHAWAVKRDIFNTTHEPAGIDVERLARAMDSLYAKRWGSGPFPGQTTVDGEYAEEIAAEYDRLTEAQKAARRKHLEEFCTFHRDGRVCGRREDEAVHVRLDEPMRLGAHVWRHDERDEHFLREAQQVEP